MKKTLFLLTVLGTLMLGSCAKKTDTGPGTTTPTTHDEGYNITGPGFNNASYYMTSVSTNVSALNTGMTMISISGNFGDSLQIRFDYSITNLLIIR